MKEQVLQAMREFGAPVNAGKIAEITGIETITDLRARAQAFLDFIKEQYPEKTVLAVGHGIINKAIQAVHLGKEMREIPRMTNAEVREVKLL